MTTATSRSPRRRTVVALAVVLIVLVAFVVRLIDIQVVNAREHVDDSLSMGLQSSRTLYASRGPIVDANGTPLATSINRYDVQIDPSLAVDGVTTYDDDGNEVTTPWPELAARIASVLGQDAPDVRKIVTDAVADNPDSQYAVIAKGVSTEQYRALADLGLPFLSFPPQAGRVYPDGAVGGNLLGFVGSDGQALAGLESADDSCLASTNGKVVFQQSLHGVVLPGTQVVTQPAVDGGTLQLTIDRDLQWYLGQLIAEQVQNTGSLRGTITVVEAKTGKIRALAEYPTVDPNDPTATPESDRGSAAFGDPNEPGSTMKAITAAIGLDSGSFTADTTVTASSREEFADGARVSDSFAHPENRYTLTGVLIDSSNVGISKFGDMIPLDTRVSYLEKFGLTQPTAVGFPGESSGILRDPAGWDKQTFYNTTFGQGLAVTVPQLAGAYQTIANGGVRMPLTLVEGCTAADGTVTDVPDAQGERVVSENAADTVAQMLENVATQGTLADQVAIPGYRVAIKTGTGEKTDPVTGAYKSDAYFTTMIGFAPADDPQYVVEVNLDEPRTVKSSAATAPAFQKALTQVLKTYRVIPSGTTTPELPKFG
ncbi:cell division protein FtsI (penicillin-binding protein 3) [Microbacterium proteolyticum]|uniref:Cell division protein FtsI (Penicillin-binding protein 3) n=1 Tax=Microbacterium proteolyticum TaxID=1572644 RepID=A0A7W5CEZ6_9MICO|nr:penicillin-binding protein 2 [Microbacterium proteolyticum]MBB3156397.1 cell division protein FtsI (penicillin-binding protein 3) [Microbacterium proteolyticum]